MLSPHFNLSVASFCTLNQIEILSLPWPIKSYMFSPLYSFPTSSPTTRPFSLCSIIMVHFYVPQIYQALSHFRMCTTGLSAPNSFSPVFHMIGSQLTPSHLPGQIKCHFIRKIFPNHSCLKTVVTAHIFTLSLTNISSGLFLF